jgi:hypothetical protein
MKDDQTMRETNIATAQSEYYKRPADERFETLVGMIAAADLDRQQSHEAIYNLRDLRATVSGNLADRTIAEPLQPGTLLLASPKGTASFTHYAFGQLARTIGAPASYLRALPPQIAADCINHGLHEAAPIGTTANLLIRDDGNQDTPTIRACTSETYGRLWDSRLYGEMARHFGDGMHSNGGKWMTPPAWPGSLPSGQYRGDRDSFVIRVDGGSIVTDPSAGNTSADGGKMYRGIMVRNSEVGHCSISIECVLYRYICGNHMIWGAILDRTFRRRHVGTKITQDTMQELATLAYKFNQRTASSDEQIIRTLIDHEIAHTEKGVIDALMKMGATKQDAQAAYTVCTEQESASPRSFWGIAQGLTRTSQDSGYQDERLKLDQLAANVIKRGALQYATV